MYRQRNDTGTGIILLNKIGRMKRVGGKKGERRYTSIGWRERK